VAAPARLAVAALASSALAGCSWPVFAYQKRSLSEEADAQASRWVAHEHLRPAAARGAHLFAESGCLACHTYAGAGSENLSAGDLTAIGRTGSAGFFARYIANPRRFGNAVMPVFGETFAQRQIADLAEFLAASKGAR
jgi:mono/diheme cytochrome c family protein